MARPKGDYDARRADVAAATWRVIGRDGLDGASLRKIASELNFTTGVLGHYFRNKDELIMFAMTEFYDRLIATMTEAAARETNAVDRLMAAVVEPLPLDKSRAVGWRILLSFMSHALVKPEMRRSYLRMYRSLITYVTGLITEVQDAGAMSKDRNAEDEARRLVAIVDGLGFSAIVHPRHFDVSEAIAAVESYIDRVLLVRDT
ncbi:MAG: TetR family transcriptional regulator C-terminal domain-containing protein [Rhodocyclaceae bacterium]|uniref:TetR/AcrR family transcriptional regulator n=1 Tax=Phenylobacterium sp. TaxID=1871053 RepID=UPI0025D14E40|nr:TetR/AcrR family transcriptional regulator [Phenylobacterium sp.]MCA3040638.1 TetR family transcriptional regulator C-terminal domain-containing protein [Rhodocyclaceae bacterium]MCA3741917.1 TetR family transcriptional regulator C-terminal domain-containing protein [Phenylobacterium sp.]MCA3754844.1 TetR family transcriptional regulator C-terminal domain-containing protein [Phenylobacterium sp.]